MKKYTICILLFSTCLIIFMNSCKTTQNVPKLKIGGLNKSTSKQNKKNLDSIKVLAEQLIKSQGACTDSAGCYLENNDFCNHAHCNSAILYCHTINFQTFCALTSNMTSGHAVFSNAEIAAVLDGAVCGNHWVRCYINKRWPAPDVFIIETDNSATLEGLFFETIYSIPLLKTIYEAGVISIELYQGIHVTSNGQEYNVIPFKVNYANGTIGYYDVSNDLP